MPKALPRRSAAILQAARDALGVEARRPLRSTTPPADDGPGTTLLGLCQAHGRCPRSVTSATRSARKFPESPLVRHHGRTNEPNADFWASEGEVARRNRRALPGGLGVAAETIESNPLGRGRRGPVVATRAPQHKTPCMVTGAPVIRRDPRHAARASPRTHRRRIGMRAGASESAPGRGASGRTTRATLEPGRPRGRPVRVVAGTTRSFGVSQGGAIDPQTPTGCRYRSRSRAISAPWCSISG